MNFSPDVARIKQARVALTVSFVGNGIMSGTLVSRLADIKAQLHLSSGQLGTALLCGAITSLIVMMFIAKLVGRLGSGRATMAGATGYGLVFALLGVHRNFLLLCLCFCLYGVMITMHDVAMNSHAVALEHISQRRIMTVLHATWSMGTLASVGIGGLVAQLGVPVIWHFAGAGTVLIVAMWSVRRWLLPPGVDQVATTKRTEPRRLPKVPVIFVALGLFGLCEQIGEGGAGDWGGVLARTQYHANHFVSTIPYFIFAGVMVIGRLFGDRLATRFSTRTILGASGLISAVGLAVGMTLNTLAGEYFAWALLGIGSSTVIPLLFSAAGRLARTLEGSRITPAAALAFVTSIAYSGYLIGPPTIGYLADAVSLHWALLVPAGLAFIFGAGSLLVLTPEHDALEQEAVTLDAV